MKQALRYSLKVWLTTLLLPMLVTVILFSLDWDTVKSYIYNVATHTGIMAIVGLVLFAVAVYILSKLAYRLVMIKGLLSVIAAAFVVGGYCISIGIQYWMSDSCNMAVYATVAVATVWFYKLTPIDI